MEKSTGASRNAFEQSIALKALGYRVAILAERGRRELSRLLGRDLGQLPLRGPERESWLYTLREAVDEHWDG